MFLWGYKGNIIFIWSFIRINERRKYFRSSKVLCHELSKRVHQTRQIWSRESHCKACLRSSLTLEDTEIRGRWFIDIYERGANINPLLVETAKLDFNMVQYIHQQDFKYASRYEYMATKFFIKCHFSCVFKKTIYLLMFKVYITNILFQIQHNYFFLVNCFNNFRWFILFIFHVKLVGEHWAWRKVELCKVPINGKFLMDNRYWIRTRVRIL